MGIAAKEMSYAACGSSGGIEGVEREDLRDDRPFNTRQARREFSKSLRWRVA